MDFKPKYGPWALVGGALASVAKHDAKLLPQQGINWLVSARRSGHLKAPASALRPQRGDILALYSSAAARDDDVTAKLLAQKIEAAVALALHGLGRNRNS